MKKLIAILLAIILVIAGLGYLAYLNSSTILAEIISKKTMTLVSIEDVIWEKDSFTIDDIMIANPKQARLPAAMRVKKIKVDAPYKQYLENPILINQIHLDSVYVNIQIYNKDQTEGNWQTLMGNMAVDHKSPLSIERSALIKKLILTNIQIDLILSDGKLHHLSPIERLVAGGFAGMIASSMVYPLEVVKTMLTMYPGKYPGIGAAFRGVLIEAGPSGFYKGLAPTLVAMFPYVGIEFMII